MDLPTVLMSWWTLLLAFSHYARYAPSAWAGILAPDSSRLAIPIERASALSGEACRDTSFTRSLGNGTMGSCHADADADADGVLTGARSSVHLL